MSISLIGRTIGESVTLKLNEIASVLRAKGEPVIHLGIGEPKSKAPLDAIISAAGILNSGEVRYTPVDGIPALKQAIIRYTADVYKRIVAPENVIASGGAKQAIMVALQAILNPQDEVIFSSALLGQLSRNGKIMRRCPCACITQSVVILSKNRRYRKIYNILYQSNYY